MRSNKTLFSINFELKSKTCCHLKHNILTCWFNIPIRFQKDTKTRFPLNIWLLKHVSTDKNNTFRQKTNFINKLAIMTNFG